MLRILIWIAAWFALMFGALQIQSIEMGHAFCGAWGCGPPVNAVLGIHSFWLTLLAPPILFASLKLQLPWPTIGKFLVASAIAGLIGFGVYDFFGMNQSYYQAGYIWQRYLLSLASFVDVPLVQALFIGIVLIFFGNKQPGEQRVEKPVIEVTGETDIVPAGSE